MNGRLKSESNPKSFASLSRSELTIILGLIQLARVAHISFLDGNGLMEKRRTNATRAGRVREPNSQVTPQLSCELCRERKVKCDKLSPCSNCVSSRTACVPTYRQRLPRGRHVRRQSRVSAQPPAVTTKYVRTGPTIPSPVASEDGQKQVEWADLAAEMHSIRRAVNSGQVEAELNAAQPQCHAQIDSSSGSLKAMGFWSPNDRSSVPRALPLGQAALFRDITAARKLFQVYLDQVDPIIKILHRPSLRKWVSQEETYLAQLDSHVSAEALSSAICYSSICSMTENQCSKVFNLRKSDLVAGCRRACEAAMDKSGLLSTKDMTVLQAFVLYLVGRRAEERSRDVWTLIAVAVRLAKPLCFHRKGPRRDDTYFNQQMRKRLWFSICVMDLQASFGQASKPLTDPDDAKGLLCLPGHINDCDLEPAITHEVQEREELTDMTFALITFHALPGGRQVISALQQDMSMQDVGGEGGEDATESSVNSRLQTLKQFEDKAFTFLRFCDPESSPYAWFTWHNTQCFVAASRLSALRSIKPTGSKASARSRMTNHTELLNLTLTVLEKARLMHTDPRGEEFRWCVNIPWHALAIAFAECCVCDDAVLLRRVWPLVEASLQRHRDAIANPMLQGPLAKLLCRTRERLALVLDGNDLPNAKQGEESMAGLSSTSEITPTSHSESAIGLADSMQTPQLRWDLTPVSMDNRLEAGEMHAQDPSSSTDVSDESWRMWEEFLTDISMEGSQSPSMFLYENFDS
ncbi:hypothetical protein B0J13DRAFT_167752 [Dactylonectria estremocensis]|uniref:Zn(2)-C6 fungal-type domain-containing protein n=1 Tax=Dactylonectria estremocensis TaxID=1079267 RepID=A0A9P9F9Q5_9HYPO|nr:hypothetical protein B0J13DRAFT_167752 [Dactylonectria estremocensis]